MHRIIDFAGVLGKDVNHKGLKLFFCFLGQKFFCLTLNGGLVSVQNRDTSEAVEMRFFFP